MLLILHQEAAQQLPGPELVKELAPRLALRRNWMPVVNGGRVVVGAEQGHCRHWRNYTDGRLSGRPTLWLRGDDW